MKLFVASIFFLIFSSYGFADNLSRDAVMALIARADQAVARKDISAMASLISETAKISMSMPTGNGRQITRLSKAGYLNALRQTWPLASNYNYRRKNLNVSMEGGRALITDDVTESMAIHGQYVSSTSSETVIIELVEGKPLIVQMEANVNPRH